MADRRPARTEANVQADLHLLLTAAPLELTEGDLSLDPWNGGWLFGVVRGKVPAMQRESGC